MLIGLGEISGLITAVSWAGSAQIHTIASRMIGPLNVTVVRIPLYVTALALVSFLTGTGTQLPQGSFLLLAVSGVMGIGLADPLLYAASVRIGPRLAVLIQSLAACITALLGYFFLGESLNTMGWIGILTASFGVAFVLMEGGVKQRADFSGLTRMQLAKGAGMTLLSATVMSLGFLFLRKALLLGVDPVWGAFVRITFGGVMLWVMMLLRGKLFKVMHDTWSSWPVMRLLIFGCCVSTVGNCLSSVAMAYTQVGIAATLFGLQPIMIMIVNSFVERKRPTLRAVIGTIIAFGGTAMLFLR